MLPEKKSCNCGWHALPWRTFQSALCVLAAWWQPVSRYPAASIVNSNSHTHTHTHCSGDQALTVYWWTGFYVWLLLGVRCWWQRDHIKLLSHLSCPLSLYRCVAGCFLLDREIKLICGPTRLDCIGFGGIYRCRQYSVFNFQAESLSWKLLSPLPESFSLGSASPSPRNSWKITNWTSKGKIKL